MGQSRRLEFAAVTFNTGAGDCEDYAIAKYVALQTAGISAEDLRIVVVHGRLRHAELRRGGWYCVPRSSCVRHSGGRSKADGSREALLDAQLGRLGDPNVPEEPAEAITCVLCNGSSRQRNNLVRCFDAIQVKGRRMVEGTDNKRTKP